MLKISVELPVQFVPGIVVTGLVESFSMMGGVDGSVVFFEQEARNSKNTIVNKRWLRFIGLDLDSSKDQIVYQEGLKRNAQRVNHYCKFLLF